MLSCSPFGVRKSQARGTGRTIDRAGPGTIRYHFRRLISATGWCRSRLASSLISWWSGACLVGHGLCALMQFPSRGDTKRKKSVKQMN